MDKTQLAIVLKAIDESKAALESARKNIENLGTAAEKSSKKQKEAESASKNMAIGFAAAGAAAATFAGLAIKAALDSAREWAVVDQQIRLSGLAFDETAASVRGFATETQHLTGYGDEYVASIVGRLLPATRSLEEAQKLTKLALDLQATGMADATNATRILAAANDGNIEALKRYVPELRNVSTETLSAMTASERAALGIKLLEEQVGGTAEAVGKTLPGQFMRLKEAMGDSMELIGGELSPVFEAFIKIAVNFAENTVPKIIKSTKDVIKWLGEHKTALIVLATTITATVVVVTATVCRFLTATVQTSASAVRPTRWLKNISH